MDWPRQILRVAALPPEPAPGESVQVAWYTATHDEGGGFRVTNCDGELLVAAPTWQDVRARFTGWQAEPAEHNNGQRMLDEMRRHCEVVGLPPATFEPAIDVAAVEGLPPRPPPGWTTLPFEPELVVHRRDRDYGRPITYYVYRGGALSCMSHSWAWLCHVQGWVTMRGLEPGERIPPGFPNAYDSHDEAADLAAIAAWDPAAPISPAPPKVAHAGGERLRAPERPRAGDVPSGQRSPKVEADSPPAEGDSQIGLFG